MTDLTELMMSQPTSPPTGLHSVKNPNHTNEELVKQLQDALTMMLVVDLGPKVAEEYLKTAVDGRELLLHIMNTGFWLGVYCERNKLDIVSPKNNGLT